MLNFNIRSLCSFFFDEVLGAGGETKTDDKPNLTKVIENAAVEVAKQTGTELKEENKEINKDFKENKEEDKVKIQDDLDEEQINFAKTLYKALNNPDPSIQKQTLKILANAANLDLKEVETKKEVEEAKETLLDLLKSGLGEYDFLADKLAPVLEKAFDKAIDIKTKDIRDEISYSKEEKIRSEINLGIDAAFNEFENSLEVKDEVSKLMDEIKPGKTSHKEYFKNLIIIAAANKGVTLKKIGDKTKTLDESKVAKSRANIATRLSSARSPEPKLGIKTPQKMNLNAAINAAIEQLASEK